jgi:hypothetical protein
MRLVTEYFLTKEPSPSRIILGDLWLQWLHVSALAFEILVQGYPVNSGIQ